MHSSTRSNNKKFANNIKQEVSPDVWTQSALLWLEMSMYGENERSSSADVSGAYVYFGIFVALNIPVSQMFHSRIESHLYLSLGDVLIALSD